MLEGTFQEDTKFPYQCHKSRVYSLRVQFSTLGNPTQIAGAVKTRSLEPSKETEINSR